MRNTAGAAAVLLHFVVLWRKKINRKHLSINIVVLFLKLVNKVLENFQLKAYNQCGKNPPGLLGNQ